MSSPMSYHFSVISSSFPPCSYFFIFSSLPICSFFFSPPSCSGMSPWSSLALVRPELKIRPRHSKHNLPQKSESMSILANADTRDCRLYFNIGQKMVGPNSIESFFSSIISIEQGLSSRKQAVQNKKN